MKSIPQNRFSAQAKLAAYALGAGAVAVGLGDHAQADVVEFGKETFIPFGTQIEIDIDGDEINDFYLGNWNPGQLTFGSTWLPGAKTVYAGVDYYGSSNIIGIPANEMIDGNDYFSSYGTINFSGPTNYFAFRYEDTYGRAPASNYGYFQLNSSGFFDATFNGGAYESTPGAGISAGATSVPEPTGIAFLAAGAGALGFWRRRRSHQA